MFEITRYEASRRYRSSAILAIGLSVLSGVFVAFFPSFQEAGVEDIQEAYPPALQELFGVEAMETVEGFLAVEVYNFVWVLFVGLYFAYGAAGLVAKGVERGKFDLLLSYPVSRRRTVVETVASLSVPLVALNAIVPLTVYAAVLLVGETIDPVRLAMVHLLSIPFLLACAGIGLVLSVSIDRADVAQRIALALVFALWLLESITATVEDLEWIGAASPTRYYDPTEILVHGTYGYGDAAILLAAFGVLVAVSILVFERRDI